jgi:hypothetical protein
MRSFGSPLLVVALASVAPARAAEVTVARAAQPPAAVAGAPPRIGVMMDAGVPDGANASLVFRPRKWLRGHLGGGYNLVSPGVRAGVAVLPFGSGPSLTLEGGHYFDGNANSIAHKIAGAGFKDSALLDRVGYDYANLHLGADFGYRRVTFYVHGGLSYVRARIHNFDSVVQSQASGYSTDMTEVSVKRDPVLKVFGPSVKMGLIVYLW